MKRSFSKQKTVSSKIPISKKNSNKNGLIMSFQNKGKIRISSKNKNDSTNKETFDGSGLETQAFAYNQDSLNNSKTTLNKNISLGKIDNKLIVFSSSLQKEFDDRNKYQNFPKSQIKKMKDFYTGNNSNNEEGENNIDEQDLEKEGTNRIDYRYYPEIPGIVTNKEEKYFWLATYDKLMKKSKIIKILEYYTDNLSKKESENFNNEQNNEIKENKNNKYNFKEKSMIMQGYEIYFIEKFNKPFIRPKKEGNIFIKLYLLNIEQINKIFSYINRLEYKQYLNMNNLDILSQKNFFKIINNSNKTIYNYSTIFFLGTFMNINIYLFSYIDNLNNSRTYKSQLNINDLPSSNKLAKLIKILLINFPDFSKKYFIDYLLKPIQNNSLLDYNNLELLKQKILEINDLLISNKKKSLELNKRNNNSINSVIRNEVRKIPTNTISSQYTPDEFNNFSYSNNSILNHIKKNRVNDINDNKRNSPFFLNSLTNDIDNKLQKPKKKNILNITKKIQNINTINNNKLCKFNSTRNYHSNIYFKYFNNKIKNTKLETLKNKIELLSKSISNTTLFFPKKNIAINDNTNKTYLRNNNINNNININNNSINNNKTNDKNNNKYFTNKIFKNKKIINIKKFLENKENLNILNSNYINKNYFDRNINKTFLYEDTNKPIKSSKIYINNNPFYLTTTNNINNNYKPLSKNSKIKKPVKVLSTVRKIINQKVNNISANSSSINIKFSDFNSNSPVIIDKNNKCNYQRNSNLKQINCFKYISKTNNNYHNNTRYVTPTKKKFHNYYN